MANAKPKRRVSAKKSSAKKATSNAAFAHWPTGLSPYHVHSHQSREGRLITVAALVVAGMAKLNKGGIGKATGKGNTRLFKALVGSTPYTFHRTAGRFTESNTLTSIGVEWFGGRIKGDEDLTLVRDTVRAFEKGGKVDGLAVEFNRAIPSA
jgi:hypothetical protein